MAPDAAPDAVAPPEAGTVEPLPGFFYDVEKGTYFGNRQAPRPPDDTLRLFYHVEQRRYFSHPQDVWGFYVKVRPPSPKRTRTCPAADSDASSDDSSSSSTSSTSSSSSPSHCSASATAAVARSTATVPTPAAPHPRRPKPCQRRPAAAPLGNVAALLWQTRTA
eukprot:EG_transcript_37228